MTALSRWKQRARHLKRETRALYIAYRDPRVPWPARALTAAVVIYAFSPIDLIPDFIPVIGYLDDLIIVPLGIALVLRMIPSDVLAESRERADAVLRDKPVRWEALAIIIPLWILAFVGATLWVYRLATR